jgi:hypothetical protein
LFSKKHFGYADLELAVRLSSVRFFSIFFF